MGLKPMSLPRNMLKGIGLKVMLTTLYFILLLKSQELFCHVCMAVCRQGPLQLSAQGVTSLVVCFIAFPSITNK
jgi:hypothetical protein